MWGNWQGWGLSAAIVLFTVFGLFKLAGLNRLSEPTWSPAAQKRLLAPITMPIDPHALLSGISDGDAGDAYRAAIKDYEANKSLYDPYVFQRDKDPETFQEIFAGAKCSRMVLLMKNPQQYVGYEDAYFDPLEALYMIEHAMSQRGLYLQAKKPEEARKYYEAIYSLGVKLFDERLVMEELDRGIGAMRDGIYGLRKIAVAAKDDPRAAERAAELQKLDDALVDYAQNTFAPLFALSRTSRSNEPGNVFLLAQKGAERVWRVAAIREMGRIKWDGGDNVTAADQRGVPRMLKHWLAHPPDANFDEVLRVVTQKTLAATNDHDEIQKDADAIASHK